MNSLVGGPLLVGGLGPLLKSGPGVKALRVNAM